MNEYGVRCSYEEKIHFPYKEYPYIDFDGTFIVTLMDKSWPLKNNGTYLICAFQTDNNIQFRFHIWRKPGIEYYMPDNTEIDFKKVPLYTTWKCTFTRTKNNNIRLKTATKIRN